MNRWALRLWKEEGKLKKKKKKSKNGIPRGEMLHGVKESQECPTNRPFIFRNLSLSL